MDVSKKDPITLVLAAKVWWSWTWRSSVGVVATVALVGFCLGIADSLMGERIKTVPEIAGLIVGIAWIPVSISSLQSVLRKYFKNYQE